LSEAQFKLRYRLSFHSFNKLLAILAPSLAVTNEKQACNCRSGKPVELPTRLAAALRYFAGGDPQDLMLIYGMSKMMVMHCVWRVVDAIHKHLDNMHFPIDDVEKLKVLEGSSAQPAGEDSGGARWVPSMASISEWSAPLSEMSPTPSAIT
jgi:hypothetical protein